MGQFTRGLENPEEHISSTNRLTAGQVSSLTKCRKLRRDKFIRFQRKRAQLCVCVCVWVLAAALAAIYFDAPYSIINHNLIYPSPNKL